MKSLNRKDFPGPQYPTRVIQFGEGNFLRAFIDWQLDLLNEQTDLAAGVTIIRPINTEFPPSLNIQDGLYTTAIRGLDERGEAVSEARIIRSVNNEINPWQDFAGYLALARDPAIAFVFSNTTEAGISYHAGDRPDDKPPVSFPAKLTQLLFERFRHFNGAADKGWTMIPCELIDYNGEALKALVLRYAEEWQLPAAFRDWVETASSPATRARKRKSSKRSWATMMLSWIPPNISGCSLSRGRRRWRRRCGSNVTRSISVS